MDISRSRAIALFPAASPALPADRGGEAGAARFHLQKFAFAAPTICRRPAATAACDTGSCRHRECRPQSISVSLNPCPNTMPEPSNAGLNCSIPHRLGLGPDPADRFPWPASRAQFEHPDGAANRILVDEESPAFA